MKIIAAGDLHGHTTQAKQLVEAVEREGADKVILLGDMLYQGVYGKITEDFSGPDTKDILNSLADKIIAVRGNCDAEVHQEFLHYPMMADIGVLVEGTRAIYFTHGHLYNQHSLPAMAEGDVLLQGHTHIPAWVCTDGRYVFNPGSMAADKEGNIKGYLLIEDGKTFIWKTMEGEEYHREELK
ncbi:MAG: phosphodiesterase [Firmicutes bacterium]|nr:phosphodiesterase [Bacillota bacterium]